MQPCDDYNYFAAARELKQRCSPPGKLAPQPRPSAEYTTRDELVLRRAVYAKNVAKIEAHNAGKHSWRMGVNKFADLMPEEFKVGKQPGGACRLFFAGACYHITAYYSRG